MCYQFIPRTFAQDHCKHAVGIRKEDRHSELHLARPQTTDETNSARTKFFLKDTLEVKKHMLFLLKKKKYKNYLLKAVSTAHASSVTDRNTPERKYGSCSHAQIQDGG